MPVAVNGKRLQAGDNRVIARVVPHNDVHIWSRAHCQADFHSTDFSSRGILIHDAQSNRSPNDSRVLCNPPVCRVDCDLIPAHPAGESAGGIGLGECIPIPGSAIGCGWAVISRRSPPPIIRPEYHLVELAESGRRGSVHPQLEWAWNVARLVVVNLPNAASGCRYVRI